MPPSQESRERRRRQNRESQQRRRERQKQPSSASVSNGLDALTGRALTAEDGALSTPLIGLPPSPPYPEYLQKSQPQVEYVVQDPQYWPQQQQPKDHGDSSWPLMDLDFTITPSDQDRHLKEDGCDGMFNTNGLRPRVDSIVSPPVFPYQSPASGSSVSNQRMSSSNQPNRASSQVNRDQSAVELNQRDFDMNRASACPGGSSTGGQDGEATSPAEKAIKEVQGLYKLGVKAGFLKRNDRVRNYLSTMRRTYHKMPYLRDETYDSSSYSDSSCDGDSGY